MRLAVALTFAAFSLGRLGLACDEDFQPCYAGDYVACACANGAAGYASCANDRYAACVCDGVTPGVRLAVAGDAEASTEAGGLSCTASRPDGGPKAYAETCASPSECASCLCEVFGGVRRCSLPCTTVETCPFPTIACTTSGFCRPPS